MTEAKIILFPVKTKPQILSEKWLENLRNEKKDQDKEEIRYSLQLVHDD